MATASSALTESEAITIQTRVFTVSFIGMNPLTGKAVETFSQSDGGTIILPSSSCLDPILR